LGWKCLSRLAEELDMIRVEPFLLDFASFFLLEEDRILDLLDADVVSAKRLQSKNLI
jgi:hypothetical protein